MQEGKWQMIMNFNKKYYSGIIREHTYVFGDQIQLFPYATIKFSFSNDAAALLNNYLFAYNFMRWKENKLQLTA